jgi:hypothetical protein
VEPTRRRLRLVTDAEANEANQAKEIVTVELWSLSSLRSHRCRFG